MMDADDTVLDGAPSGEPAGIPEERREQPDFAKATAAVTALSGTYSYLNAGERADDSATVLSVLSAAESRLSLLEAQNAELRAENRRLTRNNEMLADALAATTEQLEEGGP